MPTPMPTSIIILIQPTSTISSKQDIRSVVSLLRFGLSSQDTPYSSPIIVRYGCLLRNQGAIWPSLSPCTVINPILLTYFWGIKFWFMFYFNHCNDNTVLWYIRPRYYSTQLSHACLTHHPQVTHICVGELGQHWFRKWPGAKKASSHYLNQCWFIVNWTIMNKFQWKLNQNSNIFLQANTFENVCEMAAILSRGDDLMQCCYLV